WRARQAARLTWTLPCSPSFLRKIRKLDPARVMIGGPAPHPSPLPMGVTSQPLRRRSLSHGERDRVRGDSPVHSAIERLTALRAYAQLGALLRPPRPEMVGASDNPLRP